MTTQTQNIRLSDQLEAYKQNFLKKADARKIRVFDEGVEDVAQLGITATAINQGDQYLNFTLNNAKGEAVQLSDVLARGPVVLTWYRGGWCPYCNLQLRAFQQALPEIEALGAQLVALTPELPDNSLNTQEKNELSFEVLTDLDNAVAKQYGLVFKLIPEVAVYYKDAFDLEVYNGNTTDELPLAATYVIGQDGVIQYAFLDADYRVRAEPQDIVDVLKTL